MQPQESASVQRASLQGEVAGETLPAVVFVRGCARSGTTLVADLMNEHRGVGVLVEQPLGDLAARMSSILWFEEHRNEEDAAVTAARRRSRTAGEHYDPLDNAGHVRNGLRYPTRARFPHIVAAAVAAAVDKTDLQVIGSKTPGRWNHDELQLVRSLYPRVKYVFVVRSPLDTINSMVNRRNSARDGLDRWPNHTVDEAIARYQESAALLLSTAAAAGRNCYVVCYENLLANPRAVLAGLSDFLGVTLRDESGLTARTSEKKTLNVLTEQEEARVLARFERAIRSWPEKQLTGRPLALSNKLADCVRTVAVPAGACERVLIEHDRGMLGAGWSGTEPGGAWTDAPVSDCFFSVAESGEYRVRLRFAGKPWSKPEQVFGPMPLAEGVAHRVQCEAGTKPRKLREIVVERVG